MTTSPAAPIGRVAGHAMAVVVHQGKRGEFALHGRILHGATDPRERGSRVCLRPTLPAAERERT
jgi:hypothetical protein